MNADHFDELVNRLSDIQASEREHSYVSAATYRTLGELATFAIEAARARHGDSAASTRDVARLAVERLPRKELEAIVRDWLESRGNLGPL